MMSGMSESRLRNRKPLTAIDLKGEKSVSRSYRIVPYDDLEQILKSGGEPWIEGINRKTAWSAAKTLSKRLGKTVRAKKRIVVLKETDEFIEGVGGYLFVEES